MRCFHIYTRSTKTINSMVFEKAIVLVVICKEQFPVYLLCDFNDL